MAIAGCAKAAAPPARTAPPPASAHPAPRIAAATDVSLWTVATPTGAATAFSSAPTPTALPPEGALLGLRDGPAWLAAVGAGLVRDDPALAAAAEGALVGPTEAPVQWTARGDAATVAWPSAGLVWRFDAAGCAVFAFPASGGGPLSPCAAEDQGLATVQLAAIALARPDLAAAMRVETLSVNGTGVDAVVTATVALPAWRSRWQIRGRGDGRVVALGWPTDSVELVRDGAAWQVVRSGVAGPRVRFGRSGPAGAGAVLQAPYDGKGDPQDAIAAVARSAGVQPLGPLSVVVDWQPPKLRILAARRMVLAAPGVLAQGAEVRVQAVGSALANRSLVLSRENAAAALAIAPAGCVEAVLLGDARDDRGVPVPGASLALLRRCPAGALRPPDLEPGTP